MNCPVNRSWRWTIGKRIVAAPLAAILAGELLFAAPPAPVALQQGTPAADEARETAERNIVKLYPVPAGRLDALVAQLQTRFSRHPEVHIGPDQRTNSVVVVGPSLAQQEAGRIMNAALGAGRSAAPSVPSMPPLAKSPPSEAARESSPAAEPVRIARTSYELKNLSSRDLEHTLAGAFGKTAALGASREGATTTIHIPGGEQSEAFVVVDHQRQAVTIDAPQQTLESWRRVMESIDVPRRSGGSQVGVVPFDRADPLKIQRAIQLISAAANEPAARTLAPVPSRRLGAGPPRARRQHIGQFVSMLFQPEGQPGGGAQPPPDAGQPPPAGEPGAAVEGMPGAAGGDVAEAISRIGNVQIEFVPGLDVLIIRGNRRDVDLVRDIIRQIEELSIETQPEVEIYYLQHVDGQQMADLINQIYPTVFVSQSQVTLTPLVKPNALLVIGRKEATGPVLDLIQRLDQPVAPETQLRVFPLKHLPAIDAERTVRSLFTQRPGYSPDPRTGLGTRVLVIADFRTNSLIVQASSRDLEEVAALLEKLDQPDAPATNEVRVFKLRNSLAEELAPVLQEAITGEVQGQARQQFQQQAQGQGGSGGTPTPPSNAPRSAGVQLLMVDPTGQRIIQSGILSDFRVSADARNNQLIVTGPPQSMALMEELIRQLDTLPGAEAQVKVFTILNGDATQLATMLQTLFGLQTGGGAGQLPFGAQSVTGSGETSLVPLRFSVDTRTNSIIATGSAGDLAVVYNILVRLDEAGIRQRELRVFRLKNTSAEAVADALNSFLTSQMQLLQQQGQLVSALELIEQQVIVEDEPVTNSLIVSATPRRLPEIEKIIEDLDRRNPMVVIQLLIAEVTLNDLEEFGAEFGLQDSLLFQRGIPTPGFNFNNQPLGNVTTGVNTENTAGQGLTSFGVGRSSGAAGFGGLVLSASSESVSILIRALQQSSRAQILSRPQIQTMDNQPAFVQVGARVPRLGGQTVTNNIVTQDVSDVNVGILLGVTPRVTPDGMVVMEIDAEKSEVGPDETAIPVGVGGDGTPILSPQILTNLAQTTITARSGQTVILGGLISRSEGELTRRVPYLADIPVLGRLFRFDSVSLERRELIFILTPYIMDTPEVEAQYNFRETERMSWCLADVVNVHGALPAGTAGANAFSPQSPLIFPDEMPTGPSILRPGDVDPTPLQPLYSAPPGDLPPSGAAPPPNAPLPRVLPAVDSPYPAPAFPPADLPPSSRRPAAGAPTGQAALPGPTWRPAVPQEVQPAFQWQETTPEADRSPAAAQSTSPPAPPSGLTPATISPAGYQQVEATTRSIYE